MARRSFTSFRTFATVLLLVAGFLVATEAVVPARACASQHLTAWLGDFAGGATPPHLYAAPESQDSAPFTIQAEIDGCSASGPTPAEVDYQTTGITAQAGQDYAEAIDSTPDLNVPPCGAEEHCPRSSIIEVNLLPDGQVEAVAEAVRIGVSTDDGLIVPPAAVPLYIIDDEGAGPRYAFADPLSTLPYEQMEHFTTARIPVFRAGDASGTAAVGYTLSGGPGDPAEPADYSGTSGTVTFDANERLEFLSFTIVNDGLVEGDETITATLTGSGIESPSSVTFTILDNDSDDQPPVTRFHHPRDGLKYEYNDLRIREMHTYYDDPGGSGVVKVWLALRKLRMNGKCAWYTPSGFVPGACGAKKWLKMEPLADLFLLSVEPLAPSIGTKIRNYRAWTKGKDGAGNMETTFEAGRNLSTFEVKRP
jgi:hypothetical protein